jgi:hypothetical protein
LFDPRENGPQGSRIAATLAGFAFGTASAALAAEPRPVAPLAPANSSFVVRSIDPRAVVGVLERLTSADGLTIQTAEGGRIQIATRDLVSVAALQSPAAEPKCEIELMMSGGDRLCGRVTGTENEVLTVESEGLGALSIPLDAVVEIRTHRARQPAFTESSQWLSRKAGSHEDRVLMTNGDVVRGLVTALDVDRLSIETDAGATELPMRLIVAVRFAAAPPPPLPSPHFVIVFDNGDRLAVSDVTASPKTANGITRFGAGIRFAFHRVARMDVVGGRWEWLADVEPAAYEHTPMISLEWPYKKNRNVRDGPMRVAGTSFAHGLGVHSRSRLRYNLNGRYQTLVTSYGIDDDSGPLADVSVRIAVDGRVVFEDSGVRRGQLAGPIRVDVAGADSLELVVDFGENGDVQDRFNWVEPALIRD